MTSANCPTQTSWVQGAERCRDAWHDLMMHVNVKLFRLNRRLQDGTLPQTDCPLRYSVGLLTCPAHVHVLP
jgi:hypothetical protein